MNELKFDRNPNFEQFIRIDFSSRLYDLECSLTMVRLHSNQTVDFMNQTQWLNSKTTKQIFKTEVFTVNKNNPNTIRVPVSLNKEIKISVRATGEQTESSYILLHDTPDSNSRGLVPNEVSNLGNSQIQINFVVDFHERVEVVKTTMLMDSAARIGGFLFLLQPLWWLFGIGFILVFYHQAS